jgi:hypothetical protein
MALHPLPVRLNQAGSDTVGPTGVEKVSYRIEGLLQLTDWGLILDWSETRTTARVSMMGEVGTDVEELPPQTVEVPIEQIASVWVIGGWWRPQLEIRVKGLDVLRGVPGARGVTLRLAIQRRDRSLARAHAIEINEMAAAAELLPPDDSRGFEAPTTDPGTTDPGNR